MSVHRFGPHRISQSVHDRNRGQGLPSVVGEGAYQRLASVLNRRADRAQAQRSAGRVVTARARPPAAPAAPTLEMKRFARLEDVERAGFKRVAQGLYREAAVVKSAHPVWELRAEESGEGFVLVRKREERAVDLRQAAGHGTAAALDVGIMQRTARRNSRSKVAAPLSEAAKLIQRGLSAVMMGRYDIARESLDGIPEWDLAGVPRKLMEGLMMEVRGKGPQNMPPEVAMAIKGIVEKWDRMNAGAGGDFTRERPRFVDPSELEGPGPGMLGPGGGRAGRRGSTRTAAQKFQVSLLQVPGGDVKQRKTIIPEEMMEIEDLQRLVDELQLGPVSHNYDSWSDGEWEVRVRGPAGQLIHDYEAVGPDEIGGEKGAELLSMINSVLPVEEAGEGDGEDELPLPAEEGLPGEGDLAEDGLLGGIAEEPTTPEAAVPPPAEPPAAGGAAGADSAGGAPMVPPAGPLAPSASRLKRGRRIAIIRQGQVADAIVVMVRPNEQALDVVVGLGGGGGGGGEIEVGLDDALGMMGDGGMEGGTVETIPMVDVIDLGEDGDDVEIEIEDTNEDDPFDVDIAGPSESSPYENGDGGEISPTPVPFGGSTDTDSGSRNDHDDEDGDQDADGDKAGGADPMGSDDDAVGDAFDGEFFE